MFPMYAPPSEDIASYSEVADNTCEKADIMISYMPDQEYLHMVPHIFLTNELVNSHNELLFDLTPGTIKITVHAYDVVLGGVSPEVKKKVKNSIPSDVSKTMGLCSVFKSAVGPRVEISCNTDVADGLANGAAGVIKAVGPNTKNANKYSQIWVDFEPDYVGKKKQKHAQANIRSWHL